MRLPMRLPHLHATPNRHLIKIKRYLIKIKSSQENDSF